MNPPSDSRQLLLLYVLDDLPPDERAKIDEALIADQEFSDAFQEAQYDLIDAYVSDELAPETRMQVEQAFLSTPGGKDALAAAIEMQGRKAAPEKTGAAMLPDVDPSQAAVPIRRRNTQNAVLFSTLAASIVLVVGFVLLHHSSMQRARPTQASSSSATADITPTSQHVPVSPSVPSENPAAAIHSARMRASILVVAMPMETARGVASIPIRLHPGIQQIKVQWPIPQDSTASLYTLEIASGRSNVAVLPQHGPLVSMDDLRVANFLLPVGKLPADQYLFRLRAADASSDTPVAESSVRISR